MTDQPVEPTGPSDPEVSPAVEPVEAAVPVPDAAEPPVTEETTPEVPTDSVVSGVAADAPTELTPPAAAEPEAAEEPATAEPATAEPATVESASDPAVATEPAATEHAATEPAVTEPAVTEPAPPPAPSARPHPAPPTAQPTVPPAPVTVPAAAPPRPAGPPPESFGRVDPDGTVYVRTAAGEVSVGQFQAGSTDEALAYYVRKYTALETEVTLLEQRLAGGADVATDEATASIDRLTTALEQPSAVGDIDGLKARVAALTPALQQRRDAARAAKAEAREAAKAAREAIVAEAEQLAGSTSWKSAGDRLRALLEEWKTAPRVDRGTEQALWKRFSAARNSFDRRRRAHFAKLSAEQGEAKTAKASIVAEAEALSSSTDWVATAAEYRRLMDRWKAAGRAGRHDDDALWAKFRAAQDTFFTARSAAFDERDAGQADNLKAKEALAAEAEALLPIGDLGSAKNSLRDIQDRWEKVGHVPRGDKERVEGRLRRVEQAVRDAEQSRWKRTNPEARARAQDTVDQLEATIAKLEKQRDKAAAAGDTTAVTNAEESLQARQSWLAEAQRALEEFSEA